MQRHVIVLEDSIIFRESWEFIDGITVRSYTHPEAFLEALTNDPQLLENALCCVLDNYYDDLSETTGEQLASKIREFGFSGKIFLSTLGDFDEIPASIDAVVDKDAELIWENHIKPLL